MRHRFDPSQLPAEVSGLLGAAELTYAEVGATAHTLPAGYHHVSMRRQIGTGQELFTAAVTALRAWQAHLGAGLKVAASSPVAAPGVAAVLSVGTGRLQLSAPCRVVYTIEEPGRHGFAYGTLPGHPESGEESFVVELLADGAVIFTITAFSRPATAFARLAGPLGSCVQGWVTRRYLRALRKAVS